MRTVSCLAAFVILFPVSFVAQTTSAVPPVPAQTAVSVPGEGTELGGAPGREPVGLLPFNWDGRAICEDSIFLVSQPSNFEEPIVPGQGLPTDLNRKDALSPAMSRANMPSLHTLPSKSQRHDDMAFLKAAPETRSERNAMRDKVAPIILGSVVHAALTWDAQSTNHFFRHYPNGFTPVELDPLMRPFAGKALMYPMMNVLFGAPHDLLLVKTRHDRKPIRILTYAAACISVGLEMRQSIVNIRNEHFSPAAGGDPAKAIGRTH